MEYLVALVAVAVVGYYVWSKKKPATSSQPEAVTEVPYKVDAPVAVAEAKVEAKVEAPAAAKPTKAAKAKKPAAKKAKTTAEKAPANKTPNLKRSK